MRLEKNQSWKEEENEKARKKKVNMTIFKLTMQYLLVHHILKFTYTYLIYITHIVSVLFSVLF